MGVPLHCKHRGLLCADSVVSEQGSTLAYAVTEWGETGKSNDLCSSWSSGSGSVRSNVKSQCDSRTQT
jgi:hypothetical protein